MAMAAQAQAYHDQQYGPPADNDPDEKYFLAGWLDQCLANAGMTSQMTDATRKAFADFTGTQPSETSNSRWRGGHSDENTPTAVGAYSLLPPSYFSNQNVNCK
jgi:hypothetical protein